MTAMAAKVHATLQQHGSVAPGGMPTRSSKRASKLATRLEKLDTHPDRTTEQEGRARPECIFLATDSPATAAAWRQLGAQWNLTLIQYVPRQPQQHFSSAEQSPGSEARATGVADGLCLLLHRLLARAKPAAFGGA